jgi:predicted nuclease of predicted toxin-antitoxin system
MMFVVDAQLPQKMTLWFANAGCDAVHTSDLPAGNRTTDAEIVEFAEREQRIVVTKDADFVNSHLLSARPKKLLLISTGNTSNRILEHLIVPLLPTILAEFKVHSFLELGSAGLIVRG